MMSLAKLQLRWQTGLARSALVILGVVLGLVLPCSAHAQTLRIGGTGAAAGMMKTLGEAFSATNTGVSLEIVPSLGSSGGVAAVRDGALDLAVSSRELKPEEVAASLRAMHFATSPFGLVSSNAAPGDLKSAGVAAFYASAASTWPDGSPVRVILRPRSEADSVLLGATFPGMVEAIAAMREHHDIPVAATDQDNFRMAERIDGSLVGASLTQVLTEKPRLRFVAIDGVTPSLENLASGSYPYGKKLYLVQSARHNPTAERFVEFLRSPTGERLLRRTGNLAVAHE
jgi:phosphate transport system substrate-binding protein